MHDRNETESPDTDNYPGNLRNSARYLIAGAVRFQWQAAEGQWRGAIGITRDIGKSGLFIESESIPPVASRLKLTVALPTGWNSVINLRFGGSGRVRHVRQEPGQAEGFGASAVFHVDMSMLQDQPEQSQ